MRTGMAGVALAGLLMFAATSPTQAQSFSRRVDQLELQEDASDAAMKVFQTNGDACSTEAVTLKGAYDDARYARLPEPVRRTSLLALIMCVESAEPALAVEAARKLQTIAAEPFEIIAVNSVLMSDALQRGDVAAGARLFLALSDKLPDKVAEWDPDMASPFADYIDGEPDLSLQVARRLTSLDWTNPESARAAKNEWALAYGWQLADRGKAAEAGEAVAQADDLYVMLIVAGDKRFSAAWDKLDKAGRFDWTALAEAARARAEASLAEHPDELGPAEDYIRALRALGRYDEAIAAGQAFRARIEDGEEFSDLGLHRDDVLIALAQSLFEVGRFDEAESAFKAALNDDEEGGAVDARMAWGGRLLDLGRHKEVIALVSAINPNRITPYGKLWADSQIACAQSDTDPKAAEATLARLRAGKAENPGALSQALLCMNRIDEAADLMIWRLRQPRHRAGALDPYWTTRAPPVTPPWLAEFERRRQAMLSRPRVLAELARYGRRVEAPLTGDYWGGF